MPIRIPVVKGTPSLPASSIVFSRSAGSFVRACSAGAPRASSVLVSFQHQPEARIVDAQPLDPLGAQQTRDWRAAAVAFRAAPARTWLPDNAACCDNPGGAASRASPGRVPPADRPARTVPRYSPASRPAFATASTSSGVMVCAPAHRDRGERCSSRSSRGKDWSAAERLCASR